ncbi:hypothetical protein [Telluribacter humicola]|nr:hypothetical protein [Telluribacter humicola]
MKKGTAFMLLHIEHGFFNHRNQTYYNETVQQTDRFLKSLGYL